MPQSELAVGPKDLPRLAGDRECVARQDQFPALVVQVDPRLLVHLLHLAQEDVRVELLLGRR
jgi:hypothetical protein